MNKEMFIKTCSMFLDCGFNVIPLHGATSKTCRSGMEGKAPLINWTPYQTQKATMKDVYEWSKLADDLNIGIVAGETSNLTIVDIDGEDGFKSLAELNLPETFSVKTSKGKHLYYRYNSNPSIRNSVRLLPGIDIRTQGGYVVAPYSTHKSGTVYAPINNELEIIDLPETIVDICIKSSESKESSAPKNLASVGEGSRNTTLTSLCGSLHCILKDRDLVLQNALSVNSSFSDPLDTKEVETIVNSVCGYQRSDTMHKLTDIGVVERFIDTYKDTICFNINSGNWMIYDGRAWRVHETDKKSFLCKDIIDKLIAIIRNIPKEAEIVGKNLSKDSKEYAEICESYDKFAKQCESAGKLKSIISIAASKLGCVSSDFDSNDHVFNCHNATLVLNKGKVSVNQHNRNDFLSKISPISYNKDAECPEWLKFINRIFNNDQELISYVQRAVGYTMCGSTSEQVFFTLFGSGANGKSVFLDTLQHIMGDYGQQSDFGTFLVKKSDTGARNDIARMVGARFICASESGVFKTIDDALIKDITGGKTISARFLHKEFFEFTPQMKIFLATNHKPNIHDDSNGMWRRVRLIPFNVTIPVEERDKNLYSKLLNEASGILNWCIKGFEDWSVNGLGTCKIVDSATSVYKLDMDIYGMFLTDCTILKESLCCKSSVVYETYVEWATSNGERVISHKLFSTKLTDKGFIKERRSDGFYWLGFNINSEY